MDGEASLSGRGARAFVASTCLRPTRPQSQRPLLASRPSRALGGGLTLRQSAWMPSPLALKKPRKMASDGENHCFALPAVMVTHRQDDDLVEIPELFTKGRTPHLPSYERYHEMYERSLRDPGGFWSEIARTFHWQSDFDASNIYSANLDRSEGRVSVEWFAGGVTNICYNALDRHVLDGRGDCVAFLYEPNDEDDGARAVTYAEALREVKRVANVLKQRGVGRGDTVAIYMPMTPELPIVMLACARVGAVHSVVSGGFSAESLANRILDAQNRVVITCDGVMRAKKVVRLKDIADEAANICGRKGHTVQHLIVLQRLGPDRCKVDMKEGRDVLWHEATKEVAAECEPEWVDAEHPLFVLYTSGSTGSPKGVLHTTGGYMVFTSTTHKYAFDYHEGDVYFCTADCGWITGHSYVTYGPMLNGATQVIFEGVPTWPDAGRLWKIVEKYKVAQLYTAPTAIRALMGHGDSFVTRHDLSSLRVLGTVGEPINPEAWRWYFRVVGGSRCPIVDTWWQTETGGHMILSLPIPNTKVKPGCATYPFFGCAPAVLDEGGKELEGEAEGFLVFKKPWPSMLRTVYGEHERMELTYFDRFKGYYLTGDGCRRDASGHYWLTGRVDDILNVSGHRIGSAEIESALVMHDAIAEAAVVALKHDIKGEAIYAYVTLMNDSEPNDQLRKELKQLVRREIGAIATPEVIHWAPSLPKTRSGKIMRRILRQIANFGPKVDHKELGDTSTLAEPGVIKELLRTFGD